MEVKHAQTKEILKWFEEITKIPRCSKNEEQIANWLSNWAKENNFEVNRDEINNLCIKVPASAGYESSPTVVIQGHMDMVCEKTPESNHDFSKDPIKLIYDGDWLTADQTTLGADNGIAIAMAMALALDKNAKHPPLELLFTVDEETGLTGANALKPGFIEGKILINLDSEDEGVFTVGCAGGINSFLSLPIQFENVPANYKQHKLVASGMKGGHSGIDIALEKANAIHILARTLHILSGKGIDIRIANIKGGSAHNAIPRDAECIIYFPHDDWHKAKDIVSHFQQDLLDEFKNVDGDLKLTIEQSNAAIDKAAVNSNQIINFILVIPHGVAAMSTDIKDLVETSNNLANVSVEDGELKVLTSQRSSVVSRLKALTSKIEGVAILAGGKAHSGDGYPPWPPNMESLLLDKCVKLYENMYSKKPVVEVIHAGLECGIIGDRNPGMDMISLGPDLRYPHCPDEKVSISAIGKVWDFTAELLKNLK